MRLNQTREAPFYYWSVPAFAGYIAFFLVFYSILGESAAIFAFVPPLVVAWKCGMRRGIIASTAAIFIMLALLQFEHVKSFDSVSLLRRSPGLISVFLIAAIVGYMSDLRKRLGRELDDKNRIEAELRKQEALIRGIYLAAPVGISLSIDRVMHTVNSWLCEISGFTEQEIVGKSARIFYVDDAEFERAGGEMYKNAGKGGRSYAEARWRRKDGALIDVSLRVSPINPDDLSKGQVVSVLDITERKRAEHALAQSEARFRALYEGSNDALMLLTEKGFFDCNARTLEMFGFTSKEEFMVVHPADISPPVQPDGRESFPAAQEHIEKGFKAGNNRFEWMHRRTNGEDFPAEVLLSAFYLGEQKVLQATVRDISKRKKAEQSLIESEASFRKMFEITSEGVGLMSPKTGRFIAANTAMCSLFGYTKEEFLNLTGEDITPLDAKLILRNSMKKLFNGDNVPDHEGISLKKNGAMVNVIVCCRQLTWKGERVFYITFKDVTFLKEIERRLQQKNKELLEFTNAATHDLKKPLTTMKAIFELLEMGAFGNLSQEGKETLAMGSDSILYMKELLDDLLASAKLDAGMNELTIEEIDFMALAQETVGRLKFQIEEKKIAVFVKNDMGVARADKKAMTKVFMNLIGNAVNYIGDGPNRKIIIGAKTEDSGKVFYVRDNGIGIPEESQKNIFQRFRRGANVGDISGTGLGLSIVKGNIEAHGGKIWVESMLGKETTFYFTLGPSGKGAP